MSLKTATPRSPRIPCHVGFPPNLVQKNISKPSSRHSVLSHLQATEFPSQVDTFYFNKFPRGARRLRVQAARNQRTIEHIESYIRIIVFVSLNHYFPVTISRTSTVEELSKLIEAEYAFNYLCSPAPASSLDYVRESTQSLKQLLDKDLMDDLTESELLGPEQSSEENEGNIKPLTCGTIFSGKMELRFSDSIGDVLNENDIVRVINIYEDISIADDVEIPQEDSRRWSCPFENVQTRNDLLDEKQIDATLPKCYPVNTIPHESYGVNQLASAYRSSSAEMRFQTILHNKICLNYFRQFCLQEYAIETFLFWVEVEVYRCTKSSFVPVIADYLFNVYIDNDGPLRINIPEEIRSNILPPITSPEYLPNLSMFDEAQEYIFDLLTHCVVPRFEASEFYVKLIHDQTVDRSNFEQAYINESITKWLQFDIRTVANVMDTISKYQENQLNMLSASQERDQILEQIMNQMFTHIPMRPYFTKTRHANIGQNAKNSMMKKRLARLMGQKSAEKQGIQCIIEELLPPQDSLTDVSENIHDEHPSLINQGAIKKKKIERLEKLEDFFGKKLSTTQLAHQNLVSPEDDLKIRDSLETTESTPSCPLATYNDLSPEERRLLTKRTRKLKFLFGEPMDEQWVSKSLTNPIITNKLASTAIQDETVCSKSPVSEPGEFEKDPDDHEFGMKKKSKEIKRKKLIKLHQLLGVYPSLTEIEKGVPPTLEGEESMIQRNAKTAPPEIRKLQVRRANKLEKVFGQHPPKEFIKVNKETEIPLQKRTSIVSYLLDTESSMEDLMHYLRLLSAIKDKQPSIEPTLEDNLDIYSEEELSEDDDSQACGGANKANRQKKLSKLRRFFGNDLGLESLITQNILLRQQLVTESLYNVGEENELFGQQLNNLELTGEAVTEEYVHHTMKADFEKLRQEVQELHCLNSGNNSQSSFIKRVVRTASIPGANTFRSRHTSSS